MDALFAITGLVAVTVLTPGPNNVVVMARGGAAGFSAATPAILGILTGSLAMMTAAVWFLNAVHTDALARATVWIGALALSAMAVAMWRAAGKEVRGAIGFSPIGLALFQLANPKAWIATSTVAASASLASVSPFAVVAVTGTVSAAGLSLWAAGGALLSEKLSHGTRRRTFERVLALCLLFTALALPLI